MCVILCRDPMFSLGRHRIQPFIKKYFNMGDLYFFFPIKRKGKFSFLFSSYLCLSEKDCLSSCVTIKLILINVYNCLL